MPPHHDPFFYSLSCAPRHAHPDRKYTSGLKSPLHPPTSHENAPKPLSIHDGSFPPSAPDRKPASGQEPPLSLAAEIRRFALEALPTDPHRLMFLLEALPRDQAKAIADALPQSSRDALIAHASAILAQTAPPDTAA